MFYKIVVRANFRNIDFPYFLIIQSHLCLMAQPHHSIRKYQPEPTRSISIHHSLLILIKLKIYLEPKTNTATRVVLRA